MIKYAPVPAAAIPLDTNRFLFLDYARAFLFLWMAFDHALHAYGDYFGRYWFIQDDVRTSVADGFYLFDQCIIMPMIFFISGIFVLPSVCKRGIWAYLQERLIRLGIPFCFGVLFIVPALTYPRFLVQYGGDDVSYLTYWHTIFFPHTLQAGPLWVMYALFLYGGIMAVLTSLSPKIPLFFAKIGAFISCRPVSSAAVFLALSAILLGVSDFIWGAPWWIGFWHIFHLQGARFLLYFLYFTAGMVFYAGGFLKSDSKFGDLAKKWPLFLILTLAFGGFYVTYSLSYLYDGAFSDRVRSFLNVGASFSAVWEIIQIDGPLVLVRTTLLGCVTFFGGLSVLTLFSAQTRGYKRFWHKMAMYTYAFFLTHEGIMIWLQWGLRGIGLPISVKFIIVFGVGVLASLGICWVLMKIPSTGRILLGKREKRE